MTTILQVCLSGFYTHAFSAEASPGVCRVVHHEGKVLDSCALSVSKGVVRGTALSEAKAVLRESAVFTEYSESEYVSHRNAWLDVLLCVCDSLEVGMPHEAFLDLGLHPGPRELAESVLARVIDQFPQYQVSAALAPGKWIARLASSRVDRQALKMGLPTLEHVEDAQEFLESIPTKLALPIPVEHRARLEFLGYRWARQVATAPLAVLQEQFGKDAFLIHECARGRVVDGVTSNYPGRVVSSRVVFGAPQENNLQLENALSQCCADLASQLCSSDVTATDIRLYFDGEPSASLVLSRTFPRPVQSATQLKVATMALWRSCALSFAPQAVRIVLSGLQRSPRGQKSFLGLEDAQERSRSRDVAVSCLRAAFGEHVVQAGSDVYVPRRVRLMRVWKRATGWR